MSLKTQISGMKQLGALLSQDLSYIYGERESGPNGAKREFLRKGASFLRAIAKDLEFAESEVHVNKAGIACSGEVYLYGMWGENNGLFVELSQMQIPKTCVMYRSITSIRGGKTGENHFMGTSVLLNGDYDFLIRTFLKYRQSEAERKGAA